MSFSTLIKNKPNATKSTASWLSEPIQSVNLEAKQQKTNGQKWTYKTPHRDEVKHIIPTEISNLKRTNIDFHNWCETLISFHELNGKYSLLRFVLPEQFKVLLGAKMIWTNGDIKGKIEIVTWSLSN